jgi:ubiquinone/menaquinone biosynthesis C-methylase UbiE
MKNFEIAPLFEDCCCVDIDVEIIKKASNNFEKIKAFYGDIRDLPFWDRHFDIILDFSTIDHIEDYKKAIDEYFRVLKNKGLMLIVSWFSDKKELQVGNKDEWGMQYYFDRKEFEKKLEEKFTILKKEPLEQTLNNERYLFMFWCEKK